MGQNLSVYNLGEQGVDVDTTPIHQTDGEMLQAQNAQFDVSGNREGLRKRFGMAKLNTSGLGGIIQGIADVPLPNVNDSTGLGKIYTHNTDNDFGMHWIQAPLGSAAGSGSQVATPTPQLYATIGVDNLAAAAQLAFLNGRMYYPGAEGVSGDYVIGTSNPTIRRFDGVVEGVVCRMPYNHAQGDTSHPRAIGDMHVFDNVVYMVCIDVTGAGTSRGRVFAFDPITESLTQIGNAWGASAGEIGSGNLLPVKLWNFMGFLWAVSYAASGAAHAHYIRPGIDDTWTDDKTFGASEQPTCITSGNSLLAVGVSGAVKKVYTRDTTGTWTAVTPDLSASGSTTAAAYIAALAFIDVAGWTNPLFLITGTPHASVGQDRWYMCSLSASAIVAATFSTYELGTNVGDQRLYAASAIVMDRFVAWARIMDLASATPRVTMSECLYLTAPATTLAIQAANSVALGRPYVALVLP